MALALAHTRSILIYSALIISSLYSYLAWHRFGSLGKPLECTDDTEISALEEKYRALQEKFDRLQAGNVNGTANPLDQADTLDTVIRNNGYTNFPAGPLEGADDLVVVIKTGATEVYRSLTIHLATTLTHTPNHLIFSDHKQQVAQYEVQDALDEASEQIMAGNKDFDLYVDQKRFMAMGQSPEFLQLEGGWDLDKYKNIHTMKKAWQQRPDAKWYLFVDADSYVMLSNLLPYLRSLDHTKKLYLGDVYKIKDLEFAQGGTGYAISHGAMQYVMEKEPDMPQKFEQSAKDSCCGDYVLAEVMLTNGIKLSKTYPNFCGEGPGRIGFLPKNHCQPVVTMHHMRPWEISKMWTFERQLAQPNRYILFQDIFDHFIWPHVSEEQNEWDGMSHIHGATVDLPSNILDGSGGKELSPEEKKDKVWAFCKKTCEDKPEDECMQFQVQKEQCKIYDGMALGVKLPVTREDRGDFRSGWLLGRIGKRLKSITCEQPKKSWPKDVVAGA